MRQAAPPILIMRLDAHLVRVASRVQLRREILIDAKLAKVVGEETNGDDRVGIYITDQSSLLLQLLRHLVKLELHGRHLCNGVFRRGVLRMW